MKSWILTWTCGGERMLTSDRELHVSCGILYDQNHYTVSLRAGHHGEKSLYSNYRWQKSTSVSPTLLLLKLKALHIYLCYLCISGALLRSTGIANIMQEIITHNHKMIGSSGIWMDSKESHWTASRYKDTSRTRQAFIAVSPLRESFLQHWMATVSHLVSFESWPGHACLSSSIITCQTTIKKFQLQYVAVFIYGAVRLSWRRKESLVVINVHRNVEWKVYGHVTVRGRNDTRPKNGKNSK